MANIMDYMDWRGDLSFEADEFNEVDNLILAQLAYCLLYTSPSPRDISGSRMPSSA